MFQTANTYGITSIPEVGVHTTLPDCVIVGDWNGPSCNDNFNLNCYPEVIVDVLCACAVLRGANIFAPGILGMPHDANEGSIVGVYADLKGKCRRGYTQVFTEEKLFLGTGYVRMDRHTLFDNNASPRGIAVEMIDRISKIPNFTLPSEFGILQNLPSMLCSYMLDVNENTVVLDMCAAPGNKTTHIAALMGNKGTLIAIDKTRDKVERIKDLCDTLGLANVSAYVWDSTQAVSFGKDETENLPPLTAEYFDRILLDAPCSALGNRPQLMNNITVKQLQSYPILQKKLFRNAVKLLKVGGILVYSTCTITIEENENLVCWALDKFPELKLCKQTPMLGSPGFAQVYSVILV
ncbi:hypothetical protein AAG570_010745 [Ranatra chinensis]|uniref:SAM-dependent MTase RsmB/NOP-type domain-containing protein n=1 Tax=Ranatra chinensis TaxID=642074 RepID=A0ABD0Z5I2_9HEMI